MRSTKFSNKKLTLFLFAFLILVYFFCIVNSQQISPGSGVRETLESSNQDIEIGDNEQKINFPQFSGEISAKKVRVIQSVPNKIELLIREGAFIKIKKDGKEFVYEGLVNEKIPFDSTNLDPKVVIDSNGNIIEAYLKIGKDGSYVFGNKEINLKKGDVVVIKDGVVEIRYSDNRKLEIPKSLDDNKKGMSFIFKHPVGGNFQLPNGDIFSGSELKYDPELNKFYFDSHSKINIDSFYVINPENNLKVYLDFEGKIMNEIKNSYISYNKEKGIFVVGSNVNIRGPAVAFDKNNPFDITLGEKDHFAIRPLGNTEGSYIKIENRNKQGLIPKIETLNQYVINEDSFSVDYNPDTGKIYIRPGAFITGLGEGSSTTPIEIQNLRTKNGKIEDVSIYKSVMLIGDENEMGYGPYPSWMPSNVRHTKIEGYRTGGGDVYFMKGVSNIRLYYNTRTLADFNRLFSNRFRVVDSAGILRDPSNVRVLTDLVSSLTSRNQRALKTIILEPWAWYAGLADDSGTIHLNVGSGRISPAVARHEMAHVLDLGPYKHKDFESEWRSVGGRITDERIPGYHTYYYGYTKREDTSTFAEYVYKSDDVWRSFLSPNSRYYKVYRAKVAVFMKYGFFSQLDGARILAAGGWKSDAASIEQYIKEGKEYFRRGG